MTDTAYRDLRRGWKDAGHACLRMHRARLGAPGPSPVGQPRIRGSTPMQGNTRPGWRRASHAPDRRNLPTTSAALRAGPELRGHARAAVEGGGAALRLVAAHEDITEVRRSTEALNATTGRLLTLQDEERRRIARELHDTTVQDLAMAIVGIDEAAAADSAEAHATSLDGARDLLEQAVRGARSLSYLLHPPPAWRERARGRAWGLCEGFAGAATSNASWSWTTLRPGRSRPPWTWRCSASPRRR
jgi:Histidine kinase